MPYVLICHKCGTSNPFTNFVCKKCGAIMHKVGYTYPDGRTEPVYAIDAEPQGSDESPS